ncbi:MAG: alkaline phosphatase family protein [Chloroflexi bacterium]|nr:alkaline phosphatase family protein [Chloroflexota bacterium]
MKIKSRIPRMTIIASLLTSACLPALIFSTPTPVPPTSTPTPVFTQTPEPTFTPAATPTPLPLVPDFSHIVIIIFENKEYSTVVGNPGMPYFNLLAGTYTLLNQHYAPAHPSLPNYLSLIGGDTFGIVDDCDFSDCYIDAQSLPDLIEASGRTWKTYQDDMPEPCFTGSTLRYVRKHNPFIFFDPIRTNIERCTHSIVPLTQLDADLAANDLPNFIFITPDICYSAHDCPLELADSWLKDQVDKLYPVLDGSGEPFLIILTWDEGQGSHSCCGMPEIAGGRIATILISPQVKENFQDNTPYSHYSILKTISEAWGLRKLGHAADPQTPLITAPWK